MLHTAETHQQRGRTHQYVAAGKAARQTVAIHWLTASTEHTITTPRKALTTARVNFSASKKKTTRASQARSRPDDATVAALHCHLKNTLYIINAVLIVRDEDAGLLVESD